MNSNKRGNLFEHDSRLLERIEVNNSDLNTSSSQPTNDPIACILSPSLSLSSSIDECCRMINIAKEEEKVEKEIVQIIISGNIESLQANSGQAVMVAGHDVCIGVQESGHDERVWEWHGHIALYEDDIEFMPEYFCGSYIERLAPQEEGRHKG